MKTWQFWVIILIVIFIVLPIIVYGISLNAASKVIAANPGTASAVSNGILEGNNGNIVMRMIK